MSVESWNTLFQTTAIIAAVLTLVATTGRWCTGRILDARQAARIASLQNELAEVQPRRLTPEQRAQLVDAARAGVPGRVGFYSRMMDGESGDFTDQLADAFRDAGWTVFETKRSSLNDFPGYLNLFVTGENLEASAQHVRDALARAGIDCRTEAVGDARLAGTRELDAVYVIVGRKQ